MSRKPSAGLVIPAAPVIVEDVTVPVYGVYDTFMQEDAGLPIDAALIGRGYVSYRTGSSYHEMSATILSKALAKGAAGRKIRDERSALALLALQTAEPRA
ncbi:hypothetical protein [Aureimonas sp. AU12]|uniref:hypothetical protein n=1 Tax=Aureimonas sp. AU12 TaxID=1638161 RepID=UPI000780EEAF|nr:hypothetical protein [Aureimonas sp. AU12]